MQRMSSVSQRLAMVETRLGKLERKQATAARLRRQRPNLTPEAALGLEAALNRLPR